MLDKLDGVLDKLDGVLDDKLDGVLDKLDGVLCTPKMVCILRHHSHTLV